MKTPGLLRRSERRFPFSFPIWTAARAVAAVLAASADGVEIGLEATMYFDLNQDPAVLKPSDNKYGTRTYRDKTGEYHEAWDGDLGWSTFLDAVIRPVISNDLRQEVGNHAADVRLGGGPQVHRDIKTAAYVALG
jgi:hypothetical protein